MADSKLNNGYCLPFQATLHSREKLVKCTDSSARCGDCTHLMSHPFDSLMKACALKGKAVKVYNKCEFFKRAEE